MREKNQVNNRTEKHRYKTSLEITLKLVLARVLEERLAWISNLFDILSVIFHLFQK